MMHNEVLHKVFSSCTIHTVFSVLYHAYGIQELNHSYGVQCAVPYNAYNGHTRGNHCVWSYCNATNIILGLCI